MTPELSTCVDLPQAAERSGDLETALEWYRGVPMFRRGRNVQMLAAMVAAGLDELPDWVWARYLAYLVTRCEHGEVGHLVRDVAAYVGPAVQLGGVDGDRRRDGRQQQRQECGLHAQGTR